MRKITICIAAAGLASASIGLLMPMAGAGASTASAAFHNARFSPLNNTSTGQTGYIKVPATPGNSKLATTFKVPSISCPNNGTAYGFGPGGFLFTGDGTFTLGAVLAECESGSNFMEATVYVEGVGTVATFTPAAGDTIQVTASETSSSSTATLKDVTQNQTVTATGAGGTVTESMDGIDSLTNGTSNLPVPTFTNIKYKASSLKGKPLSASEATNLVDNSNATEITAGPLNAAKNGFKEIFVANS